MSARASWLLLAVLLGGFGLVIAGVYQRRLARDLYPPYSTLRADPLGLRALHDAVAALPGAQVERSYRPLNQLSAQPPRTIVVAGVRAAPGIEAIDTDARRALRLAAAAGSRVIVTFRPSPAQVLLGDHAGKPRQTEDGDSIAPAENVLADLRFRIEEASPAKEIATAQRGPEVPANLPETLPWRSPVFFDLDPTAEWNVLYRVEGRPVVAERILGRGSVAVVADTFLLSNEALQRERQPDLLAWLLDAGTTVQFVESHLGVQEDPGVAALARRYGLERTFFLLVLLALLLVWRQSARMVPPASEPEAIALSYSSTAGLEALLRRSVPTNALLRTCVEEWSRTATPIDRDRVEQAVTGVASPVDEYNRALRVLRRR
jgi:hypothetical protein